MRPAKISVFRTFVPFEIHLVIDRPDLGVVADLLNAIVTEEFRAGSVEMNVPM